MLYQLSYPPDAAGAASGGSAGARRRAIRRTAGPVAALRRDPIRARSRKVAGGTGAGRAEGTPGPGARDTVG